MKVFLGGTPFLAPQSAASPEMTAPALPMTPLFYCRNIVHSKNVDVCIKLELNPLRFDQDIRVLSSKFFIFSALWTKKQRKSAGFKILLKFLFYMVNNYPLILYVVQSTLILRVIKKAPKSQNIAVGPENPPTQVITRIKKPRWQSVKINGYLKFLLDVLLESIIYLRYLYTWILDGLSESLSNSKSLLLDNLPIRWTLHNFWEVFDILQIYIFRVCPVILFCCPAQPQL